MYKNVGARLSYCRNLLGISRREFVEAFGEISLPTLSRWELNYTKIPTSRLAMLVTFFSLNGIEVRAQWILLGTGSPPVNRNLNGMNKLNFDEIAYSNLTGLKNNIENFEIYQVTTTFFEPIIHNGDYIGSVSYNNLAALTNKLCLLIINKTIYIGIFNFKLMQLTNIYKESIKVNSSSNLSRVAWIAKR